MSDYRDAYEGAREDLLMWKRRAQTAEAEIERLTALLETPIWVVCVIASHPGKSGYSAIQVTGGNEHEAIGAGLERLREMNPGLSLSEPSALRIKEPRNDK